MKNRNHIETSAVEIDPQPFDVAYERIVAFSKKIWRRKKRVNVSVQQKKSLWRNTH